MGDPIVVGGPLTRRDAAAVAAMQDVERVHVNDARWWQNASFAFPALGAVLSLGAGLVLGSAEAIGFGLFLAAVSVVMLPVVMLTARGTASAIALTRDGAVALRHGRVLHALAWRDLRRIERVEYLGNVRHKLVHGADEQFMSIESEVAEPDALVDVAFALSGLERGGGREEERR